MPQGPQDAFAAAMLPDRWRVFGRTLQPLCAGHVLLLQRCGMLDSDRTSTASDHLLAAWICSHRYDPHRPWLPTRFGIWGRAWLLVMGIVLRMRPDLLIVRALLYQQYLGQSLALPDSWRSGDDSPAGAPWIAHYLCDLITMGIPIDDALTMPIARGNWLRMTLAEREGKLQLVTEHEEAALAAAS